MPLLILLMLFTDVLTLGLIALDIYMIREWYLYRDYEPDYSRWMLVGAIFLTTFSLFGRKVVARLLSSSRAREMKPKTWKPYRMDEVKRPDGTVIRYEEYGHPSKPALILIHGWNSNHYNWVYQIEYFSRTHRVIALDLPGLGNSEKPQSRNFSIPKMADDVRAVIRHLDTDRVVLYGHSIGGMIILELMTREKPKEVEGIILQHTTYTNPLKTALWSRFMVAVQRPVVTPLCYLMIFLSPLIWLNKWMSYLNGNAHLWNRILTFSGTQTAAQLDFVTRLGAMANPAVVARGILGMLNTYDVTDKLGEIDVPTLVIGAEHDKLTLASASRKMGREIEEARFTSFGNAGHQGLIERHSETNRAVDEFMGLFTTGKEDDSETYYRQSA